MTNIKNNLEKEVNRISSEWIKILYDEDKGVKMNELEKKTYKKEDSLAEQEIKTDIELMKKRIEQLGRELLPQDNPKESYLYLKGFYDATHQFMQTFEKLIEAGVFSGTKSNTDN